MTDIPCPSLTDLFECPDGFTEHLQGCPRCRVLLGDGACANDDASTARMGTGMVRPAAPTLGGRRRGALQRGDVCTVAFADCDEYLLAAVLNSDEEADSSVIAIGEDPDIVSDLDLVLEQSVLGYPAVVETSLRGAVIIEQVQDVLGRLPANAIHQLEILSVEEAHQASVDARTAPRASRREFCEPFWIPARTLKRTPSLGALIAEHRLRVQLQPDRLRELAGGDDTIERLEAGTLDIASTMPAQQLLGILRTLQVSLHEGVARLIGNAIAAGSGNRSSTVALAGGVRPIRAGQRQGARYMRGRAQAYVEELWGRASAEDLAGR